MITGLPYESAFPVTRPITVITFLLLFGLLGACSDGVSIVVPNEAEIDDNPVETPTDDNPVETPTEDNPVETPTDDNPPETPADENPVETPTDENPVETPADDNPPEPPTDENPVETDDGEDGDGETNPPEPEEEEGPTVIPFGLSERESLAEINLPIDGVRLGSYRLVNAYPNLTFLEALFVDDVPGENRLVVVEQQGRIKVFDDVVNVTEATEILDIRSKVVFTSEQGLLGFAFDPNFQSNRFIYVYYTQNGSNASIISRMPWNQATDQLDMSQEKIILQVDQPFEGHNGGMIAFGPDNYLYIALGDGGDGGDPLNHGQNRQTLLGSVLRIDVHPSDPNIPYAIPGSNPFVNDSESRGEIYAHGFRNPWRFSFDRQTGAMWLGDVGQDVHEEINVVRAGGNYGWRVYEGSVYYNQWHNDLSQTFVPPVHEYTHDKGLAVIGGYVYRGSVASLRGRYLYSDFTGGVITALTYDGNQVTAVEELGRVEGPTSFGETADGEVLVVSRYGGLFKFVEDNPGAQLPTTLSQTGLFADLASLTPASGFIEYTPGHPFWSDGTRKRRWIGIPDGSKVDFTEDDWTFPVGTVAIKHFEIELTQNSPATARRLETRVMYHTLQGWQGYTYRWNDNQTDAQLIDERQTENLTVRLGDGSTRTQQYDYPSRTDCLACHTDTSTHLLGLETAQMNSDFSYSRMSDNQLRSWNNIGLFNYDIGEADNYQSLPALDDTSASVERRARSYLEVNCSGCHQPTGSAPSSMDLRASTALDAMRVVNAQPQAGTLGLSDPKIILPGSKERSVLWYRMNTLSANRMPPLSTHVVDQEAVDLIGRWIDSM